MDAHAAREPAKKIRPGGFLIFDTSVEGSIPTRLHKSLQTPIEITRTRWELMHSYVGVK